jgi:hypothetical protein
MGRCCPRRVTCCLKEDAFESGFHSQNCIYFFIYDFEAYSLPTCSFFLLLILVVRRFLDPAVAPGLARWAYSNRETITPN